MLLKEYLENNYPDLLNLSVNQKTEIDYIDNMLYLLPLNSWNWTHIIIHHSLTNDGNVNDWESIRKYHVEVKGWKNIGYHFGIEYDGGILKVKEGRTLRMEGAHTKGFNLFGIGICVVGNFDVQPPSDAHLSILKKLVKGLILKYNIPVENVLGHSETYALRSVPVEKSCPGNKFDMDSFRKELA